MGEEAEAIRIQATHVIGFVIVLACVFVLGMGIRDPFSAQLSHCQPSSRIASSQISVSDGQVMASTNGLSRHIVWNGLMDTKSMQPYAGAGSHLVGFVPASESEVGICDVIVFNSTGGKTISHRVIAAGNDSEGAYFQTKGDNNIFPDSEPVRFSQIKSVVLMVIN